MDEGNSSTPPRNCAQLALQGVDCITTPEFPSLKWLIRQRNDFDIIHLHWPEQYYDPPRYFRLLRGFSRRVGLRKLFHFLYLFWVYAFITLAHFFKRPIVWTIHDLYPHGQTPPQHNPIHRIARKFLIRQCDAVVLNCELVEPLIVREFGTPRRTFAACLGDYRKFYTNVLSPLEARQQLGIEADDFVFLFFGSMRPHRNPLELVKIFKQLPERHLRLIRCWKLLGCTSKTTRERSLD